MHVSPSRMHSHVPSHTHTHTRTHTHTHTQTRTHAHTDMHVLHTGKIAAVSRLCLSRCLAMVVVGFPATSLLLTRARVCISASHSREDLDYGLSVIKVRVEWSLRSEEVARVARDMWCMYVYVCTCACSCVCVCTCQYNILCRSILYVRAVSVARWNRHYSRVGNALTHWWNLNLVRHCIRVRSRHGY